MQYKILEEQDIDLMINFVDDENTKFNTTDLKNFISKENNYGFIAVESNKVIGFSFGYVLLKPDGEKSFYLDAIDILKEYQNKGYGTNLMHFVCDFAKNMGLDEVFLITNKSNVSACRCYEKSGGITNSNDDLVYIFDLNKKINK